MLHEEKMLPAENNHHLILENRGRMSLSGITDVERFDEQEALITTTCGLLLIHGEGLHMETLSLDTGDIILQGTVNSIQYEDAPKSGGFFSKLFR